MRRKQGIGPADLAIGAGYCVAYVLLDYASFIHAYAPFGITPWNPPPGLSLALVLLGGPRFAPALLPAPLLADILVRHSPAPLAIELTAAALVGGTYALAGIALSRWLRIDTALGTLRDLFMLLTVAGASAALVSAGYVALLAGAGLLPWPDFLRAAGKMWIGDMIGIAVATPFITVTAASLAMPRPSAEGALQAAAAVAALWAIFSLPIADEFHLFWLLFLPLIWTATRHGLLGVVRLLVFIQVSLIVALQLAGQDTDSVMAFQLLMLALAATGLALGCLVSAQRRAADRLREQQDALSRVVRLSTMGETAAVLAHEMNQPLTAVSNYARACLQAMRRDPLDVASARDAAEKLVAQIDRAIDVLARTRDFVRQGGLAQEQVALRQVVEDAIGLVRPEAEQHRIAVQHQVHADLPPVHADPLQVQQLMLNLLRNSVEAIAESDSDVRRIDVLASRRQDRTVEVVVRDTGPGFPAERDGRIVPFLSSKRHGTGLGLSICRSIVEAHSGKLQIEAGRGGAVVRFTLPVADEEAIGGKHG